jgi:hypothetical protein
MFVVRIQARQVVGDGIEPCMLGGIRNHVIRREWVYREYGEIGRGAVRIIMLCGRWSPKGRLAGDVVRTGKVMPKGAINQQV